MAEDPPYRFLRTPRREAEAFRRRKMTFAGYDTGEVEAAERALGVALPAVFRAYLQTIGRRRGDLFRGSDLADLGDFAAFKDDADALLHQSEADQPLPAGAVVFLFHQGYSFDFFVAEGGFDSPVFRYVEGRKAFEPCAAGFADYIGAEIDLQEDVHRSLHRRGGYYVTIRDGTISESHPALGEGERPLDHPDRFAD